MENVILKVSTYFSPECISLLSNFNYLFKQFQTSIIKQKALILLLGITALFA